MSAPYKTTINMKLLADSKKGSTNRSRKMVWKANSLDGFRIISFLTEV